MSVLSNFNKQFNRERSINRLMKDFKITREKAEIAIDNGKAKWREIQDEARQNRLETCCRDGDL